jgi:hypothetical protein
MSKLSQVYKEKKERELEFEPRNLLNALTDCDKKSSSQGGDDGDDFQENLSVDTNKLIPSREVFVID